MCASSMADLPTSTAIPSPKSPSIPAPNFLQQADILMNEFDELAQTSLDANMAALMKRIRDATHAPQHTLEGNFAENFSKWKKEFQNVKKKQDDDKLAFEAHWLSLSDRLSKELKHHLLPRYGSLVRLICSELSFF